MAARAPSGTHDVLWPESARWEALVARFASGVERAGYGLAHTPIFEDVKVFRRGIGEGSDVVGKEMYEFEDRGGRTLALRAEGTAPLVRGFVQHPPPPPGKGGGGSTTNWASRPSGRSTPTSTSRSSPWPTGSSAPSVWPRWASGSTRWATRSAVRPTSTSSARISSGAATSSRS